MAKRSKQITKATNTVLKVARELLTNLLVSPWEKLSACIRMGCRYAHSCSFFPWYSFFVFLASDTSDAIMPRTTSTKPSTISQILWHRFEKYALS